MKLKFINLIIIIPFFFSGLLAAEPVDITKDIPKNISGQNPGGNIQGNPGSGSGSAEKMTDIYDIKPLEPFGYNKKPLYIALLALAALLLIGIVFFAVDYFLKRRRKNEDETAFILPPDLEAYGQLDLLLKDGTKDARNFYFRLTAIIKIYLQRRFNIDAPEMTTEELIPKLNGLDCDETLKKGLKTLLFSSEPVKFAFATVIMKQMESDLQFTREFIEKTPPAEIETEEKES